MNDKKDNRFVFLLNDEQAKVCYSLRDKKKIAVSKQVRFLYEFVLMNEERKIEFEKFLKARRFEKLGDLIWWI